MCVLYVSAVINNLKRHTFWSNNEFQNFGVIFTHVFSVNSTGCILAAATQC